MKRAFVLLLTLVLLTSVTGQGGGGGGGDNSRHHDGGDENHDDHDHHDHDHDHHDEGNGGPMRGHHHHGHRSHSSEEDGPPHVLTPHHKLASLCYDPHIQIGNTDLGWCGVDFREANCWRVIKAPRNRHVLLTWSRIRRPSTERMNIYDYQGDGKWFKVGKISDGHMVPRWGVVSTNRRLCLHFVTDTSFLNSGATLRWRFISESKSHAHQH